MPVDDQQVKFMEDLGVALGVPEDNENNENSQDGGTAGDSGMVTDPLQDSEPPDPRYEGEEEDPATEPPGDAEYEDGEFETDPPEDDDEEFDTDAPATEAPEDDEIGTLRQQNLELMQQINALGQTILAGQKGQEEPKKPKGPKEPDVNQFLLTEKELDEVLDNPELFNDKLKLMFKGITGFVQERLDAVPSAVQEQLDETRTVQQVVDDFYKANNDLATPGRKEFVSFHFRQAVDKATVQGRQVDFGKVLEDTAVKVRSSLGLKKPGKVRKEQTGSAGRKSGKRRAKPTMPGGQSGRKGKGGKAKKPKPGSLAAHMYDLLG